MRSSGRSSRRSSRGGFTLVEVLATMLLMAIALPVIMQAISLTTSAASVAKRRTEASGLAESKLNEILATGQWQNGSLSGDFGDDAPDYRWSAELQDWTESGINVTPNKTTNTQQGTSTATGGSSQIGQGGLPGASSLSSSSSSSSSATATLGTLQELDVTITWSGAGGDKSITISTLVYSNTGAAAVANGTVTNVPPASSSGTTSGGTTP